MRPADLPLDWCGFSRADGPSGPTAGGRGPPPGGPRASGLCGLVRFVRLRVNAKPAGRRDWAWRGGLDDVAYAHWWRARKTRKARSRRARKTRKARSRRRDQTSVTCTMCTICIFGVSCMHDVHWAHAQYAPAAYIVCIRVSSKPPRHAQPRGQPASHLPTNERNEPTCTHNPKTRGPPGGGPLLPQAAGPGGPAVREKPHQADGRAGGLHPTRPPRLVPA